MKKTRMLNNAEVASFCSQLAMLLPAGITPYDAILLMLEDTASAEGKELLEMLVTSLKDGLTFHEALESSMVFPGYVTSMVLLGEESGNLDIIMKKLSTYYEQQCSIAESVKNAIRYPFIMIVLMLLILIVLLTKVLPIFQQVFLQLGSELSDVSKRLISIGNIIQNISIVVVVLVVLITLLCLLISVHPRSQKKLTHFLHTFHFTRDFYLGIAYSRFASALSLITAGGIDTYEGLALAQELVDNELMEAQINICRDALQQGDYLPEAMKKAGIFQAKHLRMLQIGYKTGNTDSVLESISSYYEEDTMNKIQRILGTIEPTLVIIFSLMVGFILLSVIMPLIGIMSTIG